MPPSQELVARSGDLKQELVEFAESRRFARQLEASIGEYLDNVGLSDEGTLINAIDHFILQDRLPDGRTVLDVFVEEHPELSDEERAMLLGWRDVVEGLFEVQRRESGAVVTTNLVDELTYHVYSNRGPSSLAKLKRGTFMFARIVPLGDAWMLSGSLSLFPAEARDDLLFAAAQVAQQSPRMVFRNPEKLAQGWELQRKERQHFVDFFGSDLIVVPGRELADRMRAYMHYRTHEARDETGKTAAERSREVYGEEPAEVDIEPVGDLVGYETVGVVFDEVEGQNFWPDFGLLEEAFTNPDRAARGRHRRVVLEYLTAPETSPLPLRRLAERNPEHASRVFAQVLKRPSFDWERDGDALLRHHKPSYYEEPPLPSIIPLSDTLTRALIDQEKRTTSGTDGRRMSGRTARSARPPTRSRRKRR